MALGPLATEYLVFMSKWVHGESETKNVALIYYSAVTNVINIHMKQSWTINTVDLQLLLTHIHY